MASACVHVPDSLWPLAAERLPHLGRPAASRRGERGTRRRVRNRRLAVAVAVGHGRSFLSFQGPGSRWLKQKSHLRSSLLRSGLFFVGSEVVDDLSQKSHLLGANDDRWAFDRPRHFLKWEWMEPLFTAKGQSGPPKRLGERGWRPLRAGAV